MDGDVTVGNATVVVRGTIYPIGSIVSVRVSEGSSIKNVLLLIGPVMVLSIGIGAKVYTDSMPIVGVLTLASIVGLLVLYRSMRGSYRVTLTLASGETVETPPTSREVATGIVEAINKAIVARG